jgi:hypothetical protein
MPAGGPARSAAGDGLLWIERVPLMDLVRHNSWRQANAAVVVWLVHRTVHRTSGRTCRKWCLVSQVSGGSLAVVIPRRGKPSAELV